jgi:hypothetical protein
MHSQAWAFKPENLRYRTGKFIGAMGDTNDGHRISPQEIVQCLKQGLPVGLVKPLAGLVENQQRRLLDKGASEQRHTL